MHKETQQVVAMKTFLFEVSDKGDLELLSLEMWLDTVS